MLGRNTTSKLQESFLSSTTRMKHLLPITSRMPIRKFSDNPFDPFDPSNRLNPLSPFCPLNAFYKDAKVFDPFRKVDPFNILHEEEKKKKCEEKSSENTNVNSNSSDKNSSNHYKYRKK
jgi:hypothetical protein